MILVTGAAGYIGSMIVHQLTRYYDQPKVIGVDDLSAGYTCNLPAGFECFHGDVGHNSFMDNLIKRYKVTQIIHCAASVIVPESVVNPIGYYYNNTTKSLSLIDTAMRNGVQGFVFSSTAAVYGEPDLLGNRAVREDDPCRPVSPYGHSKLMVEQMLRDCWHAGNQMNTVILRYFNVAGADALMKTGQTSPRSTHLIKRACQHVLGMHAMTRNGPKPFPIYGQGFLTPDGTAVRDYVHVADVAHANALALKWTERHNGILTLNVGSGTPSSVKQVIAAVEQASGKSLPVEFAQRREGDPASIVADTRLIRETLKWDALNDLRQTVEHALKWEKTL